MAKCRRKDATDPGKTKASDGFRMDLRSLGPMITTHHGGRGVHEKSQPELLTRGTTRTPALHTHTDNLQTARRWGSPRPAHAATRCAPGEAREGLVGAEVEKRVKLKVSLEKTIWSKASNGFCLIFTQFSSLGPWESRLVTEHSPEMSLLRGQRGPSDFKWV